MVYPFDTCKDMRKIFSGFHIKLLIKYVTPGFVDTGELASSSIQSAKKFFNTSPTNIYTSRTSVTEADHIHR